MKLIKSLTSGMMLVLGTQLSAQEPQEDKPNLIASSEILIHAPIEKVWEVLAEDFAGIGKWSSGVAHSQGFGEPIGDSPFRIRACEITAVGFDDTKEEILEFDKEAYLLRYSLFEGLPGFVKKAENTWKLEERADGTHVKGTTEMYASGILGATLKGMMKGATRKALQSMGEELKYYLEKGQVHPNKLAAQNKEVVKDQRKKKKVSSFVVQQVVEAPIQEVWKVIALDFAEVYKSNPNCYFSAFIEGFHTVEVGAQRIMYMSENRKKYLVDKLVEMDTVHHHLTIEVIDKKGFPIEPGYTWVNFDLEEIDEESTKLVIRFNYLTKPAFLRGMAQGSLKKQFQDYAWSINHHVKTGKVILASNLKEVKKSYK